MHRRVFELHGNRVAVTDQGPRDAPPVLLVHGISADARTWSPALPELADHVRVLAPDLPGHGESDKPRSDYSLGALAGSLRDLIVALELDRVTLVGHSLGGGVAMQFAYQFPEYLERLVLVASGGLGRTVSPLLRAASLPGAELVLPLGANHAVLEAFRTVSRWLGWLPLRPRPGAAEIGRGLAAVVEADARSAFIATVRGVIDPGGQRIDATNRLYLAQDLAVLLVWGDRDPIIPVGHAHRAHALLPQSRLEVFEGIGHFPHVDEPRRFARTLIDFVRTTTPPPAYDRRRFREILRTVEA